MPERSGGLAGTPGTIDRFIPHPDVAERHAANVHAPAELVLDTAEHFDMLGLPGVHLLIRMRERFLGAARAPERTVRGLVEETLRLGWGELARTPGREIVMGAVTRPWEANVAFRAVPPERFAGFAEPDLVKIVWTLEAEPLAADRARFVTQTRVVATDDAARAKFRSYWTKFGAGIVLIRKLAVPAMKREAERRWRAGGATR